MASLHGVPPGARPAARVLVLSDDDRILLLEGKRLPSHRWWVAPGGGVRDGETFAEAAARELHEETGFDAPLGQCVWTRHHRFMWYGKQHDQYERFFVVRDVERREPEPLNRDGYIVGHRWWTLDEIQASAHRFAPRRLGELLPPILLGEYPDEPFDVGV
jgi:8-oxo-dGTP pyrophosphatase MutT (NUDIX family)